MPYATRVPPWFRVAVALYAVGWGANQFAAMLPVYRVHDGATSEEVTALFGAYALGLIPALLLVAPVSDRIGRRRVVRPVLVLSAIATLVLVVGADSLPLLLLGRLAAGVASGAAFAPGTAWVKELSAGLPAGTGARRAALSLSAGFGSGPLVAGALAEWAPLPLVVPYLPHLALTAAVVAIAWHAPEPAVVRHGDEQRRWADVLRTVRSRVFLLRVVPTAPWVFAAASTSFAILPTFVHVRSAPVAVGGALAGLCLGTGALIQPLGRRLGGPRRILLAGLSAGVAAAGVAVLLSETGWTWLLAPAAVLLGTTYGLILVGGLTTVEELAHPDDLGTLNAVFYSLTYIGFAAPLVGTLALRTLSPVQLVLGCAVVLALIAPVALGARTSRG